jgi:hypothetical protein
MTTHAEQFTESDVELAERYARALQAIENAEGFTEADVERAERHAAALQKIEESDTVPPTMQLWISGARSPYGNPYGLIAVVAATKDEAVQKARAALVAAKVNYVPAQEYRDNLLANLDEMHTMADGVIIDWAPAERK